MGLGFCATGLGLVEGCVGGWCRDGMGGFCVGLLVSDGGFQVEVWWWQFRGLRCTESQSLMSKYGFSDHYHALKTCRVFAIRSLIQLVCPDMPLIQPVSPTVTSLIL